MAVSQGKDLSAVAAVIQNISMTNNAPRLINRLANSLTTSLNSVTSSTTSAQRTHEQKRDRRGLGHIHDGINLGAKARADRHANANE